MKDLLTITANDKTFTANGVKYTVYDKISADRYEHVEKLQAEMTYGRSPKELFQSHMKMWELMNQMKFGEAAVHCHNVIKSVAEMADGKRTHPALRLCAMFINYEGEDIRTWDESLIEKKITDWKKEGIDIASFFRLALGSIDGLKAIYSNATSVTSKSTSESSEAEKQ